MENNSIIKTRPLSQRQQKIIFLILMALVVLSVSSTDIYIAALPEMTIQLNTTANVSGQTLSSFLAGFALGTLFMGTISNRFGRRRTLLVANLLYALSALAIALSPSIGFIIGLRFFQALGASANAVVNNLCFQDYMDEDRLTKAMSWLGSGMVISPAIAPILGAHLTDWFSWRANFMFSAIFGFVMVAAIFFLLPETQLKANRLKSMPSLRSIFSDYLKVISSWTFHKNNLLIDFCYGAYYAFIASSSFIFVNELGVSAKVYSLIFIASGGFYLVGTWLNRKLMDIGTEKINIIGWGCALSVIGAIITVVAYVEKSFLPVAVLLSLSACFLRAGLGVMYAPAQVRLISLFPQYSAAVLGFLFFATFMSGAVASAWVSVFHQNHLLGLTVVTGVLAFALIPLYALSRK